MHIGAKAVLAKIHSDGQTPTDRTYQKFMEGYAYHGAAEEICNLIEQRQLRVDRFMMSQLIMAYLNRYVENILYVYTFTSFPSHSINCCDKIQVWLL